MIDPRAHVQSVSLRVRNAEATARLYEGAVGLQRVGEGAEELILGSPDGRPLVVLHESRQAPRPPRRSAGLFHTAIRFSTRPQLADALRRVLQAGNRLTGASDHGVSEALYLDDPEGNGVELYWDRARDEWPVRPDGGIEMYTRPLDVRGLLASAAGSDADPDVDIGHAHLKVTDIDRAIAFWGDEVGMDLKVTYGREAAFLAAGDYHHHIGANTWYSAGGVAKPEDALGLERVTLAVPDGDGSGARLLSDPDGILVEFKVV